MKWFKFLAVLALVVVAVGAVQSATVAAPPSCCATPPPPAPIGTYQTVVYQSPSATLWLVGSNKSVNKLGADAAMDAAEDVMSAADGTECTCDKYWSKAGSTMFNDYPVVAKYKNHHAYTNGYDCNGLCMSATLDGVSKTLWRGYDPYFPQWMQIQEAWKFYALDLSLTVPGGFGYSVVGDTAYYDTGQQPAYVNGKWHWKAKFRFSNLYAKSFTALFGADDTLTGCHYLVPSNGAPTVVCASAPGSATFF